MAIRHGVSWAVGMVAVFVGAPAFADTPAWVATTTELLRETKPGFGGLSGVLVDPADGTVYVDVSDRGVYRSTDQARTWKRLGDALKGRTESPGCFQRDPVGKRLLLPTVYGGPVAVWSGDAWRPMAGKCSHVDWCAVDWTDPEMKLVLALKHESGGTLIRSDDGGKTFAEVGKGFGPSWVFDGSTAVVAEARTKDRPQPRLMRSTDAGKTFAPSGTYFAQALPRYRDGVLYWLADGKLLATTDKGKTWEERGAVKDGRFGPVFGAEAKHLLVLTGAGIVESRDGGRTWSKPLPPPKDLKGTSGLTWLAYDPKNDILYLMKMGSELYQLKRGK